MNKKYYFPLVFAITIAELVLVVLIAIRVIPIHPGDFHFQQGVDYTPFIREQDTGHVGVVLTQWFFYLLTFGTLLAVNLVIIGELARKAVEHRARRNEAGEATR